MKKKPRFLIQGCPKRVELLEKEKCKDHWLKMKRLNQFKRNYLKWAGESPKGSRRNNEIMLKK